MISVKHIFAVLVVVTVDQAHGWWSRYDQELQYSCHNNQFLSYFRSEHSNRAEDRVWDFGCANLPESTTLEQCSWTDYVNNFDQLVSYMCPSNKVVVGINSYHSNSAEDRRFKFLCCLPQGKILHSCAITGNANSFDGPLLYTVPGNRVLTGMVSVHDNRRENENETERSHDEFSDLHRYRLCSAYQMLTMISKTSMPYLSYYIKSGIPYTAM